MKEKRKTINIKPFDVRTFGPGNLSGRMAWK